MELAAHLAERISSTRARTLAAWVEQSPERRQQLMVLAASSHTRTATNALWLLALLPKSASHWLQTQQNHLIDMVMTAHNAGHRRILMQILRAQDYPKEGIRTDFMDFCLTKINSRTEAYGVRAYCIYCAFKMCRHYPEMTAEFSRHLDMLAGGQLPPGLRCALRRTRAAIIRH